LIAIPALSAWSATYGGRVSDFHTDAPIRNVRITICDTESGSCDVTFTDGNGDWSLSFPNKMKSDEFNLPDEFRVLQNYPNPFNPVTNLPFYLPSDGAIEITVTNLLGQTIDRCHKYLPAGSYSTTWKSQGSAGVYFYTIRTGQKQITRKMIQLDGSLTGGLGDISPTDDQARFLSKPNVSDLRIVSSKFGYHSDTLITTSEHTYFTTFLQSVHSYVRVADMHNDISEQMAKSAYANYHLADRHSYLHTDIPRLQDGGLDIQVFAIWDSASNGAYQTAINQYNRLTAEFTANPETIQHIRNYTALDSAVNDDRIAGIIFLEGGHYIENDVDKLKYFYDLGVRGMTITWNNSTSWAVSAKDEARGTRAGGLNAFGRKVIAAMDSLGMIIDVSHVGIQTISDILATSKNPIIASHSNARALCNHYRNLSDDQIRAIAAGGGLIGACFYPYFLNGSSNASLNDVINHINYIVNLVGVDYVGIGSDFDGIEVWPGDLQDVSYFPRLTGALLNEGYTEEEIAKIMGGNFLRIFRQVCGDNPNI
jgi:membrane dipeptidase